MLYLLCSDVQEMAMVDSELDTAVRVFRNMHLGRESLQVEGGRQCDNCSNNKPCSHLERRK